MRLILLLVVPVVLFFGLALALIWLPLPGPFPSALSSARSTMAAVVVGLLGLAYVGGVALVMLGQVVSITRALDVPLAAVGLAPARSMVLGRAYGGELDGRPVHIRWTPGYRLRPGQLVMRVDVATGLTAIVGEREAWRPTWDSELLDLALWEHWSPKVRVAAGQSEVLAAGFARPGVRQSLRHLLETHGGGVRTLMIAPDHVLLRARPGVAEAEAEVVPWLRELMAVAAGLAAAPAAEQEALDNG